MSDVTGPRKVILYELNEVPWRVVDDYAAVNPAGVLATTLRRSRQYVTVASDVGHLSPWRTWPSLHRGVPDERHLISDLGQDLTAADRAFPPIWRLLRSHGLSVGVCGSLHSYPPPEDLDGYAFYLPDAFAGTDQAHPRVLSRFQAFNLSMTRSSARNVDSAVSWADAARMVAASRSLGIRPMTYAAVAAQLFREWRQPEVRTRRRTFQAVLAFDVFISQVARTLPDFSTFFSNHVASAMHRYWAAAYPSDYARLDLDSDWRTTFGGEISWAMHHAERMLGRLVAFADAHPEFQVWTASSMGQHATMARALETAVYLTDLGTFMRRLGLPDGSWQQQPAMLPQCNVTVNETLATTFEESLSTLKVAGKPLRYRRGDHGFFAMDFGHANLHDRSTPVRFGDGRHALAEFGMQAVEIDDRSGTTAYHVPEGVLFTYDPQRSAGMAEPSRPQISALEIAPALLETFGVPAPGYMAPVSRSLVG